METASAKIEHLNLALRAIRNVNRLLVKEKRRDHLLRGICDTLIKNRGYNKVWIIVLNPSGQLEAYAESGFGSGFFDFIQRFKQGQPVACIRQASRQTEVVLTKHPATVCRACPLSQGHAGWGSLTIRLTHAGTDYGFLCVSIPSELISEDVEQALVTEIAEDISYGLYRIERDRQHRKDEMALQERVKELNYVFAFSGLIERPGVTLDEILQGAVDLIPSAMRYPEITCARVALEEQEFKTANFRVTADQLTKTLWVHDQAVGTLSVGYLEERPKALDGPFLTEERELIASVAARMGKTIERKRVRAALEESERRFRDLVENSLTCIAIIQDGRVLYRNPEHIRLFGPEAEPFILPDFEKIHPDDVVAVRSATERFQAGQMTSLDIEFRFYGRQEKGTKCELRWVHCRVNRIDSQGRKAFLVNLMDISRAKELEHLLRMQDKMTSLGRVAAGIAHEIRNPLSGINIYLKTLEKMYKKGDGGDKVALVLSHLQSASNKIESVIKRVMDFSKPSEPHFTLTDINRPLEEAVTLSAVTLRKSGIRIDTYLSPGLPRCKADPQMIEQVILNLITNASEAMKDMEADKRIELFSSFEKGAIHIRVCDSGPGVPQNMVDNIFDPFYTTKNSSSGIGLSICQRIVTDHGGALQVATAELGGAEFTIKLPVG